VSFNLASNASLGTAITDIEKVVKQPSLPRQPAIGLSRHGGVLPQFACPTKRLPFFAALAAVYIVLGVLYESFNPSDYHYFHAASAGVGALLALMICREDLSVVGIIGIILLIGIVKKNGI